jgi:hypothetical protein
LRFEPISQIDDPRRKRDVCEPHRFDLDRPPHGCSTIRPFLNTGFAERLDRTGFEIQIVLAAIHVSQAGGSGCMPTKMELSALSLARDFHCISRVLCSIELPSN